MLSTFNRLIFRVMSVIPLVCGTQMFAQSGVAIIDSNNSRAFFAAHYTDCSPGSNTLGATEWDRYLQGWVHVLNAAGLPPAFVSDNQISESKLGQYRALILPNAVSLSDDEAKTIRQWVLKGGHLLATFGSGYKDIVSDPRQADNLALQEGGTTALHNLWGDPMSKVFSTQALSSNPAASGVGYIRLTQLGVAPTLNLTGLTGGNLIPYGSLANLLIQRPAANKDVFGVLNIDPTLWTRTAPAILVNSASKGLVVYFAFAPEYLVALENGLPRTCSGFDPSVWAGRSQAGASLMLSTVQFLLQQ